MVTRSLSIAILEIRTTVAIRKSQSGPAYSFLSQLKEKDGPRDVSRSEV